MNPVAEGTAATAPEAKRAFVVGWNSRAVNGHPSPLVSPVSAYRCEEEAASGNRVTCRKRYYARCSQRRRNK